MANEAYFKIALNSKNHQGDTSSIMQKLESFVNCPLAGLENVRPSFITINGHRYFTVVMTVMVIVIAYCH